MLALIAGALRTAACVLALAVASAPSSVREAQPPPAPEPKPAHRALFSDDFSGDLHRWKSDHEGVWTIRQGMLRARLPDKKQQRSFIYAGNPAWTNYALDLDVCGMRGVDKGVAVRVGRDRGIGVDLRGPGYQDVLLHRSEWQLGRAPAPNLNGEWHHLRIEARGHRYRVFVDGVLKLDRLDEHRSYPQGRIALAAYTGGIGRCTVYYDNVVVSPLE